MKEGASRRENMLLTRLAAKEQECHELKVLLIQYGFNLVISFQTKIDELRSNTGEGLRHTLLDPVVNAMFGKLREKLVETEEKLTNSQQELLAWKFSPDRFVADSPLWLYS
jgi:hypothetical protein